MKFCKKLAKICCFTGLLLLALPVLVNLLGGVPDIPKVYAIYLPPQKLKISQKVIDQVAASVRLNAIILDHNDPLQKQLLEYAKTRNLYTIVRIVVFDQGTTWQQAQDQNTVVTIFDTVRILNSNHLVDEIQLDYIRFRDDQIIDSNKSKYISQLVGYLRELSLWKKLSIDVFGRVAEQDDDVVGQSISALAPYVDIICPMLYPSHYGLHPQKRKNPYLTIYDGVKKVKAQLNFSKVAVRPYLQAFQYILEGIAYERYLQQQILAAEDIGDGYAFWNSAGEYQEVFAVLNKMSVAKQFRQSF